VNAGFFPFDRGRGRMTSVWGCIDEGGLDDDFSMREEKAVRAWREYPTLRDETAKDGAPGFEDGTLGFVDGTLGFVGADDGVPGE